MRSRSRIRTTTAALALCILTTQHAEAQPVARSGESQFGGDSQHTGRSVRRGPHEEPVIAWRVRARHRVFASPVSTADGWTVFAGVDGGVHAVDSGGTERWARLFEHEVFATPATWGPRVLVGRLGGGLSAIDSRGRDLWTFTAREDIDAPVVVSGDTAYVASRGVTALDATGRVRWTTAGNGHVFGAPAVSRDGTTVYLADLAGNLTYLRASDGHVVREISVGAPVYGGVLALDDGMVVVGARDGHVRAFVADGGVRWDFATRDEVHSTPALMRDGTVVVGSDDGGIYGLRAADGTLVFRVATAGRVRSSACIDADGFVFVGSEDDMVYALDAHGAIAWRFSIGADVDSSPWITPQGWLVVGSDDAGLYALAPRTR